MEFPVINRHGTFTHIVSGSRYEFVLSAAPVGGSVLMADIPDRPSYWDAGQWHDIPPQTDPYTTWDESARQWVDARTPAQRDSDTWGQIKRIRDSIATEPLIVDIDGIPRTIDADSQSQAAILSAALRAWMATSSGAPWSITWTLADNTEVELTAAQMLQVFQAMTERAASARLAASASRPASTRF
jgi:hypothetical protein